MVLRLMNLSPAALNNGDSIYQIAGTLAGQASAGAQIIAVITAMTGVTDLLIDSIRGGNYSSVYTKLLTSHTSAARRQGRDETARKVLIQDITNILDSYRWLGKSLANRSPTPTETDTIALLGEKLCARLLAASLQNRHLSAASFNAGELLVMNGQPDIEATRARVESRLIPLLNQGYIAVVTASTNTDMAQAAAHPQSAPLACTTALAACTSPDEIWLWSDSETYTVQA
jgi:aspartokinase